MSLCKVEKHEEMSISGKMGVTVYFSNVEYFGVWNVSLGLVCKENLTCLFSDSLFQHLNWHVSYRMYFQNALTPQHIIFFFKLALLAV